ncbi:hypothetical protein EUA69_02810 [TM7 phylum sp. oral taxon 352]|nr:hypothetical protein EUA77_03365 [TM7 phylum sp. oral taxon 351]TWP15705.1 hypothetical protein EUA74_00530 [TM7 phylum sp. oral taxon 352]TWP16310.1 hypothetical protein EUA72_01060 [TM7 phylum sp. oral taxon 352]TWP16599.1 hypothetical protein EUA69_02810 [TM7 phylum sp. oral taxon 352]TWP18349.1 hypothetical protein EUA70_01235 [TM7 phylum sp. oral taxon 352]
MNTERFTSQNNNEDDRPVIEIPKSVVKIGAVALATLGIAGVANALGLFYSPKSPEKGPSPAHQVAQVVEDYSNGIITELPEDTEIHTVTLEEGENPTSAAETAMEEYNEENPENKIDPNEARSSIYETSISMKELYKDETGNTEIQPGTTVNIAIGDINGDGKPSIAIAGIENESK